jgi:phosphohistidine phosphatase SixA
MMRCLFVHLALFLFIAFTHQSPAMADGAAALSAMRLGGVIALMRHTEAPGGAGDPPGFKLDDCATQRNLSDEGRDNAKAIGARLKREGVSFARILSSPWCRCLDTATLLDMGDVERALAFSNIVVLSEERATIIKNGRDIIEAWAGPGTLLVVTHGANIQAMTSGRNPAQGEIVVVDKNLREIGRIPPR